MAKKHRLNKWEAQHKRNIARYEKQITELFREAVREAASLTPLLANFSPDKPFSFDDYPITQQRVDELLKQLKNGVESVIANGVRSEWTLANNKNNELCNQVFGDNIGALTHEQYERYYSTNPQAVEAFINRKEQGLNLSDRVWRYTDQFKEEIELGLDLGLREGLSADAMSRQLRSFLNHPDALFRRVRDEHGILRLSKAAKAFHPGRGVYRSAYKNARRLAATESNIAYRTADYERWQQLDFVVGIRVVLSNNHTLNGEPFYDICDRLSAPMGSKATKGRGCYPKDFKFTGWHPLCRCHTETILKTLDEMRADEARILAGEPVSTQSENSVDDVPQEFKDWIKENEERIERAKSLPYFIRDNFKDGNIELGLKFQSIAQLPKTNAFSNATSMREVVERLKRLGIKDIELGDDLTLAEANIVLEAVEDEGKYRTLELNKFGIASNLHRRADLRAIQKQEVGGFYNSEKKILYIDANIFRQSIYRNPKSWEERIDELEIKIVKAKEDIAKYESYLGKNKKFDKELKGYISNAKQQILGFEKQIYQYNEYKKQGITPFTKLVAEQFEAIELQAKAQIHHEFGHYVDDILGRPSSNIKGVHQSISEYGNKYANEGFAEWYTHYRMKGVKGLPEDLKILFNNYDNLENHSTGKPHYGAAMKLGRKAAKEAQRIIVNIDAPNLTIEQQRNIEELANKMRVPKSKIKPMSFLEADEGASNPFKDKENCQSCVVAFSARRRGLNCAAGRYDEDASGIMKRLGDNFSEAWVNPKTGKTLTPTILRGANDKEIIEKLKKQLSQPGEYVLGYNYKNGDGHVVNIINDGGNIIVHDEQAPRQSERYRNLESFEGIDYLELIRVDKALLNIKLTSQILFIL